MRLQSFAAGFCLLFLLFPFSRLIAPVRPLLAIAT